MGINVGYAEIGDSIISPLSVNVGDSGVVGDKGLLPLSAIFGASDDGFAIDFTTADGLYQDSGATTPVTADGDLIGYATDETGNGNHFTQATAADKPEWTADEGITALDLGDNIAATWTSTLSDFTVIARVTDPGNIATANYVFRTVTDANNRMYLAKTAADNIVGQTKVSGSAVEVTLKSSFTAGTVHTQAFRYNDSSGEVWGQWDNDTAATDSRTPPQSYGTPMEICRVHSAPINRIIVIDRALSDAEVELAKTMVEQGWSA